jgi:effector-binding domain-containing protein
MEIRVQFLEQFILDNGLEIPYPIIEPIFGDDASDADWLPF